MENGGKRNSLKEKPERTAGNVIPSFDSRILKRAKKAMLKIFAF